MSGSRRRGGFTLVELLAVIVILALVVALLLPALSAARKRAMQSSMGKEWREYGSGPEMAADNLKSAAMAGASGPVARPLARVKSLEATVGLTPRLSVGTAQPESIYEAKFSAKVQAVQPPGETGECEIQLPLPPQLISLADLTVGVGVESSDNVALRDGKLVWRGKLTAVPTLLDVTYTAVGKGLYSLQIPPGGIVDVFNITLTTNKSDVQMLQMSLQPTGTQRSADSVSYTWGYKRLMMGLPIALDVLGIAPIDRLGELGWLGPMSVVLFGLLVGMVARAFSLDDFDRWMLLLVIGTFTAAYPLMYFAQEYMSLNVAIGASAAIALLIIAARCMTSMGANVALAGVVLPGAAIMAITLWAAVKPGLQGILLTLLALGFFVVAMVLIPRARRMETRASIPPALGSHPV